MGNTTRHGLAAALVLALSICPSPAPAHQGAADDEQHELTHASEATAVAPALADATPFAAELERAGAVWLFPGDRLQGAVKAARMVRMAADMAKAGAPPQGSGAPTPPPTVTMERARTHAEAGLLAVMPTATAARAVDLGGDPRPAALAYHPLPSDTGYVLLKITGPVAPAADAGVPAVRFAYREIDLEKHTEISPPVDLPCLKSGVTWMLLKVTAAPVGETRLFANYVFSDAPKDGPFRSMLGFACPAAGRLTVEILDENRRATPAMVRLTNRKDGTLRRPEGAIDFSAQTDDICGGPSAGAGLPEPLKVAQPFGGFYWVVDGGFSMSLPRGEWEIHVQRGVETVAERREVTVGAEPAVARFELKRWTDMKARGWWSGDDHVHSRLNSDEDARRLMAWTKAADIHVANVLRMGNRQRTYYEQRGFGPAFRVVDGDRALVPGQEDPRYSTGHCIGLNLTAPVRDTTKYLRTDWVAEQIHKQGGLFGHAHVSHEMFGVAYDMTLTNAEGLSDFGSVMQGTHFRTKLYYDFLNLGFRLAVSSGSDTPYSSSIGESRVYANLGKGVAFSPDAWFAAMGKGRTFVTNGPMLELTVDTTTAGQPPGPGDELALDGPGAPATVKVTARAWGMAGGSAPAELQLVRLGQTIATKAPAPNDPAATEATIVETVPATESFWIAAYARGRDGSEAHCTPVYVVRDKRRTWDTARVPELIAKRRSDLNGLAEMLKQQQAKSSANQTWFADVYNQGMADDAPGMLERIERARAIYTRLESEAKAQERGQTPRPPAAATATPRRE